MNKKIQNILVGLNERRNDYKDIREVLEVARELSEMLVKDMYRGTVENFGDFDIDKYNNEMEASKVFYQTTLDAILDFVESERAPIQFEETFSDHYLEGYKADPQEFKKYFGNAVERTMEELELGDDYDYFPNAREKTLDCMVDAIIEWLESQDTFAFYNKVFNMFHTRYGRSDY